MALFIVDSNFFIQAHRATYPLDIAIGFWTKVQQLAESRTIASIDKVKNEIYANNDELKIWCKENLPSDFFRSTTEAINEYRKVSEWALSKDSHYMQSAINEFLGVDEADAFLIAFSLVDPDNRYIVTQEVSAPQKKSKIKIPDCCNALGVNYVTTIEMFRKIGETF